MFVRSVSILTEQGTKVLCSDDKRGSSDVKARTRDIIRWELIGAVFIVLAGSALHFVFAWTGGWRPVALVAAVNESIWEHLKLAFWPGFFWALLPLGLSILIMQIAAYALLTYFPPDFRLFVDGRNGLRGIPPG